MRCKGIHDNRRTNQTGEKEGKGRALFSQPIRGMSCCETVCQFIPMFVIKLSSSKSGSTQECRLPVPTNKPMSTLVL